MQRTSTGLCQGYSLTLLAAGQERGETAILNIKLKTNCFWVSYLPHCISIQSNSAKGYPHGNSNSYFVLQFNDSTIFLSYHILILNMTL